MYNIGGVNMCACISGCVIWGEKISGEICEERIKYDSSTGDLERGIWQPWLTVPTLDSI